MNEWAGHYLCDKLYISSITQYINYAAKAISSLVMPNSKFRCFKTWLRKKAEINH
jgi:hypothetical protein